MDTPLRLFAAGFVALALGCGRHDSSKSNGGSGSNGAPDAGGTSPDAGPPSSPDAGGPVDAGAPPDGGSGNDGGGRPDACLDGDAGAPAALEILPCPGTPEVLWSRAFPDVDVDFRGAADQDGNLYWVEYDPPWSFKNPNPPAFLVSADGEGKNRYRIPAPGSTVGSFMLAANDVVMSQLLVVTAYVAATGATSWSLDLTAARPTGYDSIASMTDLGDGHIAFTRSSYSEGTTTLYVVETASGHVVWWTSLAGAQVLGSNGGGLMLVASNPSSSAAELIMLDSAGQEKWKEQGVTARLFAWASANPWLVTADQRMCAKAHYTTAPGWFGATMAGDLGFAFSLGTTASSPDDVQVFDAKSHIATGPLAGTTAYDGFAAFPLLAGDHIDLLGQKWTSAPGLCYPAHPGEAFLARIDATSIHRCPLSFAADSAIGAAALLPGRLIVGWRTYSSFACGDHLNPVTIRAYALPGESMAPSGWVQSAGNPGLGHRPRTP